MKLVFDEADSKALRAYVRQGAPGVSCALVRTEVVRVARELGAESIRQARAAIEQLELMDLDDALLDAAGLLPVAVRSLDAIHLAAAQTLGSELTALVTYDERMASAARELGLEVVSPR